MNAADPIRPFCKWSFAILCLGILSKSVSCLERAITFSCEIVSGKYVQFNKLPLKLFLAKKWRSFLLNTGSP